MPIAYLLYSVCIIILIINIMYYKSTKYPWRNGLIGSIGGIVIMIPTQLILQYLGFSLMINYFTLAVSLLLGIPGVIIMGVYTIFF